MKTKLILRMTVLAAVFCGSMANAQIIYSNNFALGAAVNISNTPPTVANTYAGGTNSATWNDALGVNDTGDLLANGVDNTPLGDSWLLPFVPQSGHIYLVTASVTFTNNPGNWVGVGFAQNNPTNIANGNGRYADSGVNGYDFAILSEGTGNVQYFAGPHATLPLDNQNNLFPPGPGTNTVQILLNTENSLWSIAGYVNGIQAGTNYTYATNTIVTSTNELIQAVGITQSTVAPASAVQWNNFALSTTLQPFIVQQPTASQIVAGDASCTNKVTVWADPNGGTLAYQWYVNGAPLVNGTPISGANTNVLVINPISSTYELTNYYVIVSNNYGSATSALASVTVLTNPVINFPRASTNLITLFGGTSISGTSYVGSSPAFSVTAVGAPPLIYQWLTNGVVVGGATNASLAFTNLQADGPSSFVCIVSNSFGPVSATWSATYVQTPLAPYPQAVLAAVPLDFWRLNEPDNGLNNGNAGAICHDYQSGDNGVYTNTYLGNAGYNSAEPTETSARFGKFGGLYSYAGQMQDKDFAVAAGGNAEFTVEAWVNSSVPNGAPAVSQGVYGSGDSFALGQDTNSTAHFQFYIRSAGNTVYKADSSITAADGNWHHLVGVCDEAKTNVTLYVDGNVAASTGIPVNSGLFEANAPIAIGAGDVPTYGYDLEFEGYIDDVATYSHALSIAQVISQYASFGNPVPITFVSPPPTNGAYLANQTLTIPATVAGSGPLGYYWTNLTTGSVIGSGQSSTSGGLVANLSIPNASTSLNGDQVELFVTNAISSTNSAIITLFNPAPPIALDYSSPILYSNEFNGGTWSIAGMPVTAANSLVGGTSTTWVDSLGTNDTAGSMTASGTPSTTLGDSWVLPFTPHSGYVYTLTASLTFSGYPGNWVGIGFAQNVPTNATTGRLSDTGTGPDSYGLIILTESSGNVQYFAGPSTGTTITNKTPFFTAGVGTHTVQEVLDTTGTKWKVYAFVDGVPAGTNTYSSNPPIGAVGFTQNVLTAPGLLQWNYFALTQVAPGGVPPYLLTAVPPTNVTLLADSPLSIAATNFGSAPFGYYWSNTNTAAILAAGANSTMTPLSANLTIADVPASWNGNTLALVMTNAYGTNISLVLLTVTSPVIIPTNVPSITGFSLVGGTSVTIDAANGQSGGTYYLRGSTNLTMPLSQWLPVATNVITTNGDVGNGFTFTGTNVIKVGTPQQFYILSNTN